MYHTQGHTSTLKKHYYNINHISTLTKREWVISIPHPFSTIDRSLRQMLNRQILELPDVMDPLDIVRAHVQKNISFSQPLMDLSPKLNT